jgi:2-isopropylmalate synthase
MQKDKQDTIFWGCISIGEVCNPESATAAATRVMIEFRDKETEKTWTTVSVDRNVISTSLNALVGGFEYALVEHVSICVLRDDFFEEIILPGR